jgi:hypothetical protein
MKKSILLFGSLLAFTVAFSQNAFYTQDFGSGIPAGWINAGVDANSTAHTNMWKYTTSGNHGYATNTKLASPTQANGWIIFDSDSMDNAGGGAQGSGGCPAPQRGYLTTTPINCSGHTNVLLQFYQLYFSYEGNPRVIVNNGTAADTIEVNTDYNFTFGMTPNPSLKQYDISSIAANQPNVTVTFLWDNFNGGFYYYWQVDDISLIDAPANDLQISQDGSFDYYSYPISELDSIYYYAFATSVGSADQYDARVAIKITENNSIVFTDTSPLGITLPYGVDSPLVGTNAYLPTSIGTYKSYLNVFSDSVNGLPYDVADTGTFYVSDSVFAVDNGVYGGSFFTYLPASESSTNTAAQQEWASIFYLPNADTITSVTAAFDNLFSTVGSTVHAAVYSLPSNYQGYGTAYAVTSVIQTEVKLLTATDLPQTAGYGAIRPVNFKILNSTGTANAAVLQPGFYAVSILNNNDSAVAVVNGFAGAGLYGTPGGEITGGSSLAAYSNVHLYIRANFGHNFNLLQAAFTRNPGINPVTVAQNIKFTGNTNSTGDANTVYNWSFQSPDSTYSVGANNYTGQTVSYTFPVADSVYVCLNVSDNGQTAQACNWMKVRDLGTGIQDVNPLSAVTLVPNPTSGRVTITADDADGMVATTITDMLGNTVKTFNDESNGTFTKTYDLSNLTSGIYFVKIENAGTVVTKKLSLTKQ